MKILAHLGLAFLLVVSLGAAATGVVWVHFPGVVASVDAKWVDRYTEAADQRLAQLEELAKEDRAAATAGLEELREGLASSFKRNRRFPARRRTLQLLADLQFEQGDLDAAMDAGEEILEHSPNDVPAHIWFGRRACAHPETRGRGLEVLGALFERLPELGVVARACYECALTAGDDELAGRFLVRHLDRALRPEQAMEGAAGAWQVWWSDGGVWAPERRVAVEPKRMDGVTVVAFALPEPAARIRVDAPSGSRLAFSAPRFEVVVGERPLELPLPMDAIALDRMHLDRTSLYTTGAPDPHFVMPLPTEHRDAPLRVRLVFEADRFPLWIGAAASTPTLRAAAELLPEGARSRSRLRRAREQFADHAVGTQSPR